LQKSLSSTGHRSVRAEGEKNNHFNVHAVHAVR
jgi:hypothetical protein